MLKDLVCSLLMPVEALFSRIVTVAGAIIFCQFPAFVQAYLQRLGGHLDEITRVLAQYNSAAAETGKTLKDYIAIHLNSNSPEIVKTGQIISDHLSRAQHLEKAMNAIKEAGSFSKFTAFVSNADWEIARETFRNYTPGLSFNMETVLYGIAGIIVSMILYYLIKMPLKIILGGSK